MEELAKLRLFGTRMLAAMGWVWVVLLGVGAIAGHAWWPVGAAALLSLVPTLFALTQRDDVGARIALGITTATFPALLLAQWSGTPWLIDMHMTFFAAIAVLAILADWRPILAAAVVTAVHHLVTNFLAPSLVFSGGPDLGRVVLHAVVVVVETGALVALAGIIETGMVRQATVERERGRLREVTDAERSATESEQRRVVETISEALAAMASGDLSRALRDPFPPAFEDLRANYNRSLDQLGQLIGGVNEAAHAIRIDTVEVRSASDDLAKRTERQASSLEDASNTMGRLVGAADDIARSTNHVDSALAGARSNAEAGNSVVAEAMETMARVEKSAAEIRQIIALIDGIAFQTNLLALNAGVEAARAGDAGKGFAVVANEVRALAQRSAEASSSIRALIDTSTAQVEEGVALVGRTGEAFAGIMSEVSEISSRLGRITEAAQGNASDLRRVKETINQIDSFTQQNAAMAEESNASLRSLAGEAESLLGRVSRFTTPGATHAPALRRVA